LIIGYTVFIFSNLFMVAFTRSDPLYAYILAAIFGVYVGISETVQRTVIPRYVTQELRGTAYGIFYIVTGAGFFVSNIVFGFLWDNYSLNAAVYYSIVLALAAVVGMMIFTKKYPISRAKTSVL
jgi:MFS family permease